MLQSSRRPPCSRLSAISRDTSRWGSLPCQPARKFCSHSSSVLSATPSLTISTKLSPSRGKRAGVEAEPALKTINAALSLRSEDSGAFTTIDLLCLNLSTREAALYKYGAAPTYIKRHGTVRKLTGTALPAGLQEIQAVPAPIRFPVERDTFVLMVSDGVTDALTVHGTEYALTKIETGNPQRVADMLLAMAEDNGMKDDGTVVAVKIFSEE